MKTILKDVNVTVLMLSVGLTPDDWGCLFVGPLLAEETVFLYIAELIQNLFQERVSN